MEIEYGEFEIFKVVSTYNLFRSDAPRDLKIEVIQYESGRYEAIANYSFWSIDQASPYQHNRTFDNETDAVKSVIESLNMFRKTEYSTEDYCWVPIRSNEDIAILGTGKIINKKDFLKSH